MWQDGGMVEPWTRERRLERTRSLLLDAAEQVFAERGFISATLDDIAKAAGYSKGAIYKYFATKEELVDALRLVRLLPQARRFTRQRLRRLRQRLHP